MPEYLEITLGSDVHVTFPAGVLAQQDTQAIIDQLTALFPPQPQHVLLQATEPVTHLPAAANNLPAGQFDDLDWQLDTTNPFESSDFDSLFTAAVAAAANQQATSQPAGSQFTAAAQRPAVAAAAPAPIPQQSPPVPRRHNRRKTPPGFAGYRQVAQHVALRVAARRPFVQLGEIYEYMARTWPEWFVPPATGRPASWQSGVRHAVLKHFERVPAARAPAPGVWYKVDASRLV